MAERSFRCLGYIQEKMAHLVLGTHHLLEGPHRQGVVDVQHAHGDVGRNVLETDQRLAIISILGPILYFSSHNLYSLNFS